MAEVKIETKKIAASKSPVLVIASVENDKNLEKKYGLGSAFGEFLEQSKFTGKKDKVVVFYPGEKNGAKIVLVGLGPEKQVNLERVRLATALAIKVARELEEKEAAFVFDSFTVDKLNAQEVAEAVSEAVLLTLYRFDKYKTDSNKSTNLLQKIVLIVDAKRENHAKHGVEIGVIAAEANNLARDFIHEPADALYPESYAARVKSICQKEGLTCHIFNEADLKREKMNAILAVGKGSERPPRLVVVEYNRSKSKKPIVLVGKGITFDTGGISIKPAQSMDKMKYDMSGSAICFATALAASRLNLPHYVVAIMAIAENMPSGSAYRPGDIVKTRNGLTVNVLNTDAEGRMVLSDALDYAKSFHPQAVVDVATLTGACAVCFGEKAFGVMGTNAHLVKRLLEAGEYTGERCWELPLWEEYDEDIKDDCADYKNIGNGGAGTIIGGKFLSNFIKGYPWVHMDIASTAWITSDKGYMAKGPTAVGLRLLLKTLRDWKAL